MTNKVKAPQLTSSEIADAFIMPRKLNKKQEVLAKSQLLEARVKSRAKMTGSDQLAFKLMQLRLRMEEYLKTSEFDSKNTFGYFLKEYLYLIDIKGNVFANDISVHNTLLSQLKNSRRLPNDSFMIRLEIHSNNTFPAAVWHRVVEREKEYIIQTDKKKRQAENKKVKRKLNVV